MSPKEMLAISDAAAITTDSAPRSISNSQQGVSIAQFETARAHFSFFAVPAVSHWCRHELGNGVAERAFIL